MTADQVWQILVTVGGVAVVIVGATWALSSALGANTQAVSDLRSEVGTVRAEFKADMILLRTSIDSKFALLEEKTRAEIEALKLADGQAQQKIAELHQMYTESKSKTLRRAVS